MDENRVLLCGSPNVGKSELFNALMGVEFNENYLPTEIARTGHFRWKFNQEDVNVFVWDVTGNMKYRKHLVPYFTDLDVIVFIFDPTNNRSFDSLSEWAKIALSVKSVPATRFCLVSTKSDVGKITVPKKKLDSYLSLYKCQYFALSSKTRDNIDSLKDFLASNCIEQRRLRVEAMMNGPQALPVRSPCC